MLESIEHKLQMNERQHHSLTGMITVINFDENEIRLMSTMGILTILGDGLHITLLNLDDTRVGIEVKINNLKGIMILLPLVHHFHL